MRVSDYIFEVLADYGVEHVFVVTGGGAMFLNDALKNQKRITYVCNHHEQACAIAAEGYARSKNCLAVVSATTGPGGTNCMTGVLGQWLDSIPVLYLSGQVKFETTVASMPGSQLRQLGDQEIDIVELVKPITKYAKFITDPKSIKKELQLAIHHATTGRPGPVWLDIPLDVQGAPIDVDTLEEVGQLSKEEVVVSPNELDKAVEVLKKAKRPVLIAGHGIRLANAQDEFKAFIDSTQIPVILTFNGYDMLPSDHPLFIGRVGTLGSRAGNFAVQNSDCILFVGTRNNIRQVSYNWESFGRHAYKVIVDIDAAELTKKTMKGDLLIHADAGDFLTQLNSKLSEADQVPRSWLEWCRERKDKYPIVLDEYRVENSKAVHPYHYVEALTQSLPEGSTLIAANGSACVVLFQAGIVKENQRVFWNSGCASMGFALPASLGAAVANGEEVYCLTGDGSLQMNLQELQTIATNQLPVKTLILNNAGYQSIKQTQTNVFSGNFIGCDSDSGLSFPNYEKLADLYDMPFFKIDNTQSMQATIDKVIDHTGPLICEIELTRDYVFSPKLSSVKLPNGKMVSKPLEDLSPLLDRDEFNSNMIVENDDE